MEGGVRGLCYSDDGLFIVLWLLNSSKQVQEAVGGYFKDPTGTTKQVGSDMRSAGENFTVCKDNTEQLKEQLQKAIKEVPHFEKLRNHIDMTVTHEGLRIELTESDKRGRSLTAVAQRSAATAKSYCGHLRRN